MGQTFPSLTEQHADFIHAQKIFFVGTAAADGRVNVSPKGMDSLRVLGPNRVAWLNVTGSGNETAAHVQLNPRMTIMFCAFEGNPLIMRLYGSAKVIHPHDTAWGELQGLFPALPGARQVFDVTVETVATSCGFGVPNYTFTGERPLLNQWAEAKGEAGIKAYWEKKNQVSIDGFPTNILSRKE